MSREKKIKAAWIYEQFSKYRCTDNYQLHNMPRLASNDTTIKTSQIKCSELHIIQASSETNSRITLKVHELTQLQAQCLEPQLEPT